MSEPKTAVLKSEWVAIGAIAACGVFMVAGELGCFRKSVSRNQTDEFVSYKAGFEAGVIDANRKTLDRAIALLDTFKVPVNNLNAADVMGIIGECAVPRGRDMDGNGVEPYETADGTLHGYISIRLNREKLVDPEKIK